MGQLGGTCPKVLKRILKIVCASQIAVKYLLKDFTARAQTWSNYKHNNTSKY